MHADLRIAFLGPTPNEDGGVAEAESLLLRGLVESGVEVDLYAGDCPPSLAELGGMRVVLEPVVLGPAFRILGRAPLMKFVFGQSRRAAAQRRLVLRMLDEHRRRPYDVVYQFSQPELLTLGSHREMLPPLVVHPETHAAGELEWHRREDALVRRGESRLRTVAVRTMLRVRSRIQRRDLRSVAAVVCPSASFARHVVRDYGIDDTRVHVVPNPIDLDRFKPAGEARRTREIVYVSRISVRKGVEMVVDLSHRLDDLAGSVRLVVAGSMTMWSDYRPLLKDLNTDVAEYRGYASPATMPALLGGATLLVQPSRYEPFALTVAEALACGTPVVVSDAVGAGEWLDDRCAVIFPSGDGDAFERGVRLMLDRMEHSEQSVRSAARDAAERAFTPAAAARGVADVIRSVRLGTADG